MLQQDWSSSCCCCHQGWGADLVLLRGSSFCGLLRGLCTRRRSRKCFQIWGWRNRKLLFNPLAISAGYNNNNKLHDFQNNKHIKLRLSCDIITLPMI